MSELREKIEEAWWKVDIQTALGLKLMPAPKDHKNLIGDKQKYLDSALRTFKAHIAECMAGCPRLDDPEQLTIINEGSWKDMVILGAEAQRKMCEEYLRESLE